MEFYKLVVDLWVSLSEVTAFDLDSMHMYVYYVRPYTMSFFSEA